MTADPSCKLLRGHTRNGVLAGRVDIHQIENISIDKALAHLFHQVLEELNSYNHSISEIDVAAPEHVAVIPDNDPILIFLGDNHFLTRYETFISQKDLYDRLKEEYGIIESVDVTYDDRIIFHTSGEKGETVTAEMGNQS